ncbi:hypothetical protein NO263_04245 [Gluconacetobacter entanii]|uniref:DUF3990 domain-containing protein n=3 Tax=Acetobacteraceae TaxID=433 RepID=A0A7H4IKE8_9PROT|nr:MULTISPECIES: hypothetical protein [Acetobacteraceae]MCW4589789.1 hypothetical protein [Gluconacetobacter entanii]MCW4593628.1 hypothetical protein [Gluconacetobacter entanii]NPC90121.1 hypothetical protein [Gluconacetobacter entanii]PYD69270.1 hypothetical protein CFR76_10455 [Komagataeibacter swingsii]QIP36609.1 hypothetical protein GWK63_15095 [Komagataeibacter rhaeticus]
MTALHTSFVLGYHGCSEEVGRKLINGESAPTPSETDYDWLGPGFYVWESDPLRAQEWAYQKQRRDSGFKPFVIGLVVDLGNCLDLTTREDLEMLKTAYEGLRETLSTDDIPMPVNRDSRHDVNSDKLFRNLDCAVIRYLHDSIEAPESHLAPYDTVRGLFQEGGELYPGSAFREKTHTQIAIRNLDCIKGIFRLPDSSVGI